MAKAKKSSADAPAKSAKKSSVKKQQKPAEAPAQPLIDTSAAAEAAARLLLGKAKLGDSQAGASEESNKESAAFKQLKQNAKGPAPSSIAKSLGNTFAPKNTLPGRGGQNIHSQTQGFSSRVNVPRRTGG